MDVISTLYRLNIISFLKRWKIISLTLGLIDILAITLAYQTSYIIFYYFYNNAFFFSDPRLLKLYLLVMPFWLLILYLIQVTEIPRTKKYTVLFFEYLQSTLLIIAVLMTAYFVFKLYETSRLFLLTFSLLGFIFLFLVRVLEYEVFKTYRSKGFNQLNIVLIADDSSLWFIENIIKNKEWGYKIVAIISSGHMIREKYEKDIVIISEEYKNVLYDLMEVDVLDEVLYLKGKIIPSEVREIVRYCEELGVVFSLRYEVIDNKLSNAIKTQIGEEKFLTFINVPHSSFALAIKKIMDISVSLFMVLILSPVLLFIAIVIKVTSPGPVIFKQSRVGLRGRLFNLYKFRTMVVNAEELKQELEAKNEADGPAFKLRNDPRVTNIGSFLRKTGLDELPQLFNILKGEMSLIGPRPPLPSETKQYKRWQLRRLSIKPGLSCFWQIKPDRNSIKFEQWMEMDLAYIDNWSLRLDFIILIKTIRTVFKRTGL
jgi:exopolysaccharide biosynthesis polyprenyl glycosylphosphotransferase